MEFPSLSGIKIPSSGLFDHEFRVEHYVIQGTDNYNTWTDNYNSWLVYQYGQVREGAVVPCNDYNMTANLTFTSEDDYYFIFYTATLLLLRCKSHSHSIDLSTYPSLVASSAIVRQRLSQAALLTSPINLIT